MDSFVFVSSDLRSPIRMPVVALMNYLAQCGHSVTVITNNKSAFDDYRYDYRIVRRSFVEPFKGINTRADILAQFAQQLSPSVFVMTNSVNRTVVTDADVIRKANKGHKIVVWELVPFYRLMLTNNYADASAVEERSELFDAFVSCYEKDYLLHERFGQENLRYLPFFFPFRSDEYSVISGQGSRILFVQTSAASYLFREVLQAFAEYRRMVSDATLCFVHGINASPVSEDASKLALSIAAEYGVEEAVSFAQPEESFKSLVRESLFAIVGCADCSHTSPTVLLQAYRFPYFLASEIASSDYGAGVPTVDAGSSESLVRAMLRFRQQDVRDAVQVHMTQALDTQNDPDAMLRAWRALLCAVDSDLPLPEEYALPGQAPQPQELLAAASVYHLRRTAPLARFSEKQYPKKRFAALRCLVRYEELRRTEKYTYTQMAPQDVRRSQLLALTLLREFERICIKYGLTYYVAAGSLLGAARHHAQIPWDDDVDVTMPRKDYNRFIEIAQQELPDTMILPVNNYPYGFHRIQMKGTNIERTLRQKGHHGVFLDVLPLDGAAPTEKLKKRHERINTRLMYYMFESARPIPALNQFRGKNRKLYIKRVIIKLFGPKRLLYYLWRKNAEKYDVDTAQEWVCLPGSYGYEKECFPKYYWGDPAWLEYENKLCPVMQHWEDYLTLHYGDYMQCPAELEKRTHLLFSIDFGPYRSVPIRQLEENLDRMTDEVRNMQAEVDNTYVDEGALV